MRIYLFATFLIVSFVFNSIVVAQQKDKQKTAKVPYLENHRTPYTLDYEPFPIDPRKPCTKCVRPCDQKAVPLIDLPALRGRPHVEKHLGGCKCGKKHSCDRHPFVNWYWPVPLAAHRENFHPNFSAWADDPCRARFTNLYDKLADTKIIPYTRTDTGYCGMGRDPYGCPGESKIKESGVYGLEFRQPGEPVFGSPTAYRSRANNAYQAQRANPWQGYTRSAEFDNASQLRNQYPRR